MDRPRDPYRPLDDEARAIAARCGSAPSAALATLRDGRPMVTRVATLWLAGAGPSFLISDLSDHARALDAAAACSLLLGEPGAKGDPLTHPRLTVMGEASVVDKDAHRGAWLAARPKAGLYYDFTDFRLWHVSVAEALLNAGFGRAYRFGPSDLN